MTGSQESGLKRNGGLKPFYVRFFNFGIILIIHRSRLSTSHSLKKPVSVTTENLVLKSSIFKYIIEYFQGLPQKDKVDTDG